MGPIAPGKRAQLGPLQLRREEGSNGGKNTGQ